MKSSVDEIIERVVFEPRTPGTWRRGGDRPGIICERNKLEWGEGCFFTIVLGRRKVEEGLRSAGVATRREERTRYFLHFAFVLFLHHHLSPRHPALHEPWLQVDLVKIEECTVELKILFAILTYDVVMLDTGDNLHEVEDMVVALQVCLSLKFSRQEEIR